MVHQNSASLLSMAQILKSTWVALAGRKKEVRKQNFLSYLTSSHGLTDRMAKRSEEEDLKWDMRKEDRRTYSIIYTAVKNIVCNHGNKKEKDKRDHWKIVQN